MTPVSHPVPAYGPTLLFDVAVWTAVPIDESQVPQDIARLRDSVDEELRAQLAGRQIDLSLETIREIAYGVAVQLDYAYEFTWMPRWEGHRRTSQE